MHPRFNRTVWAFKKDFVAAAAKWLVRLSPYTVPDNLPVCLEKFAEELDKDFVFDSQGMIEIQLSTLTGKMNSVIERVPEIMALNESRNPYRGAESPNPSSGSRDPDDDFLDVRALAQNITCEFAQEADCLAFLDQQGNLRALAESEEPPVPSRGIETPQLGDGYGGV